MMSSLMPSEKYSCSGSPLMLANGSTQMETCRGACEGPFTPGPGARSAKTWMGRSMLRTVCSPRSSNAASTLPTTWSRT